MPTQFKNVPLFDGNTANSPSHLNASSEAVLQLQQLVHELAVRVQRLEASPEAAPKTSTGRGGSKSATAK